MTATVRTAPVSTRKMADADLRARVGYRPAGQLWERVAEGQHISDAYTWRGPLAIYSGTATPKCSGIIRAGQRLK